MDAAFSAVVLLALVVPGAAFTYAYSRRVALDTGVAFSLSNATSKTFFSIIYSVPLNALWVWLTNWHLKGTGYEVDVQTVVYLATGHYDDAFDFDAAIREMARCAGQISFYFVSLYLVSAALGMVCFEIVNRFRGDLRWSVLRFPGDWDYIVRGELDALPRLGGGKNDGKATLAAVAVELAGEAYVYIGVVMGTTRGDRGKLEKLLLKFAVRYKLSDFLEGNTTNAHRLDAEIMVIPEREIKNIAFKYIEASQKTAAASSAPTAEADDAKDAKK